MEQNYVIKYAVMPVSDYILYPQFGEKYGGIFYVVSKCYVVKDKNEAKADIFGDRFYRVIFPYMSDHDQTNGNKKGDSQLWVRIKPEYDAIFKMCKNSMPIDFVFDTYEEALNQAQANNEIEMKELEKTILKHNLSSENLNQIKEAYQQMLSMYRQLERQFEQNTEEMQVNKDLRNQTIIISQRGKYYIADQNIYEYIRYCLGDFCAYHISLEDYEQVKQWIESYHSIDEAFIHKKRKALLGTFHGENIIRIRNYDCPEKQGCFYLTDKKSGNEIVKGKEMHYDEMMTPLEEKLGQKENSVKIYTAETYYDILNAYIADFVYGQYHAKVITQERVLAKRFEKKKYLVLHKTY